MGIAGIGGDGPRDVPDGRQPLPGEADKPFLEWQGFLLSDASGEVRGHALRLRQTASAKRWAPELVTADAELSKARAVMLRLVASRLAKLEPSIPVGWFGEDAPPGRTRSATVPRAGKLIAIGASLLGFAGGNNESQVRALLGAAFGFDALHVSVGDFLGGDPLFPDPPAPPPGGFQVIKDLPDGRCVLGIGAALGKFAAAAATQRPRQWAQGTITSVAPRRACPGDVISILGSGFGASQPVGVEVRMTAKSGGCVAADVVSWSDTQIQVRVPPDTGHGCVGLIENPAGSGEIVSAASDLAGEIETCLGLAGFGAGRAIRDIGASTATACPSCGDPATAFEAGPPVTDVFAADNALVGSVAPGGTVTLSWSVIGADSVSIDPRPAGSLPAIPGPLASDRGTAQAGPLPLQDGDRGTYVLTAANGCGAVTRELDIVCRGKRALALSGGGTKGAFEVGAARCLYDVAGLRPDIISGASVGALNAAKLAEGPAALSQLEALWLGLTTKDDFYLEPGWFTTLDSLVQSLLSSGSSNIGGQIAAGVIELRGGQDLGRAGGARSACPATSTRSAPISIRSSQESSRRRPAHLRRDPGAERERPVHQRPAGQPDHRQHRPGEDLGERNQAARGDGEPGDRGHRGRHRTRVARLDRPRAPAPVGAASRRPRSPARSRRSPSAGRPAELSTSSTAAPATTCRSARP